jgi:hypothetical protein
MLLVHQGVESAAVNSNYLRCARSKEESDLVKDLQLAARRSENSFLMEFCMVKLVFCKR